ncbi:uncharacterized protein LOC131840893 isoform X2 [Achroia grisella]|uniref:uncharacterized protein LOC131840893 isoform X2 n=1 Tax=Achroia grisella TaxID=688607 RepID=UPI0027D1ED1D|nr:uncharacterized protein LOC131840893 isoform X2 [Achroia grisella]XP_059045081.1 uncharacterized protein LOC131840893 isoform X2 [Achroia grisella]
MACEHHPFNARVDSEYICEPDSWRRHCGCIKTSDKLKKILKCFPSPPPPTPVNSTYTTAFDNTCISGYCTHQSIPAQTYGTDTLVPKKSKDFKELPEKASQEVSSRSWRIIAELVQLLQLSVSATALALYYLIYCYMQLVYYTLRSALYFHHADGPMKITIGVVAVTSLVVGFNLVLRMERLIGLFIIQLFV